MTNVLQILYEEATRAEGDYKISLDLELLDQAREQWQQLLSHPDFAALSPEVQAHCLNRLGLVCWRQHWGHGQKGSLDAALTYWQTAVSLISPTADEYSLLSTHLSVAFHARFEQTGDKEDLDTAVTYAQQAIQSAPTDSDHRPSFLNNLGSALQARYQQTGNLDDLNNALSAWEEALAQIPDDHSERPSFLHNRALGLLELYERTGQLPDLEEAVACCQTAISLVTSSAVDNPIYFNSLGSIFITRYRQLGKTGDLDNALSAWQTAVDLTPISSPSRPQHLNNLGNGWRAKYDQSGQLTDLEQALALWQEAVALTPTKSPERARHLHNLGAGYQLRYAQTLQPSDLDNAIACCETAVSLTPTSSPSYLMRLANLGTGTLSRFERQGDDEDLQTTLAAYETVVANSSPSGSEYASFLAMYGQGLQTRFIHQGQMDDLNQSIALLQHACDVSLDTAANYPLYLSNLAESLRRRYQLLGKMVDLEHALAAARQVIALSPENGAHLPDFLNGLGTLLRTYYQVTDSLDDLQAAINALQKAIDLSHPDSTDRALYLTNLGTCWQDWYQHSDALAHLDTAVDLHQQALTLIPDVAIYYTRIANNLGTALNRRYLATAQEDDAQAARIAYKNACIQGVQRDPFIVLQCAQSWGNWALERGAWSEALEAYAYGSQVMSDIYPRQTSQKSRNAWLRQGWRLYLQITYALARQGSLQEAVLTLERERTRWLQTELGVETAVRLPAETINWEVVKAVSQEPLVYLLVSHVGGLALLVYQGEVTPIWFAGNEDTWNHRLLHQNKVGEAGGYLAAQLGAAPLKSTLDDLLTWLGTVVMQPIQQALRSSSPTQTMTLIPTGRLALLPWHAAQSETGAWWLDACAIRYAPSAFTLWRSQQKPLPTSSLTLCSVATPVTAGLADLPYSEWESAVAASCFQPHAQQFVNVKKGKTAVLPMLTAAHYLHFACHGQFAWENPLDASIYLPGEERLTLADIQKNGNLPMARLVFLSACQTGMIDFDQAPDEGIGLSTSFLQAGAKGVVATLWPVPDLSTALFVQRFYEYHIQEKQPPHLALRLAQQWLARTTAGEIATFFAHLYQYAVTQRTLFSAAWRRFATKDPEERPFAHPYYWAAFTFTGA